jgi:hypothetical protein
LGFTNVDLGGRAVELSRAEGQDRPVGRSQTGMSRSALARDKTAPAAPVSAWSPSSLRGVHLFGLRERVAA